MEIRPSWRSSTMRSASLSRLLLGVCLILGLVSAVSANACSSQNTGKDFDSDFSLFQSVGRCSGVCKGYALGILQGKYCWCSNSYPGSTTSMSKCSDGCPGFQDDKCGNEDDGLYNYITLNKPSTTVGSGTTSTSTQSTSTKSQKSTSTSSTSSSSSTASSSETTSSTSSTSSATSTAAGTSNGPQTPGSSSTSGDSALASSTTVGDHSDPENTSKSSGVSKGAIAGIVVGVVCGVGLLVALLAWFLRRRRNPEQLPPPSSQAGMMPGAAANGLGTAPYNAPYVGYGPMMEGAAIGTAGGFMDSRMRKNSDIYDNADRRSNVSLRDDQDYSRPVLRLANPDPDN